MPGWLAQLVVGLEPRTTADAFASTRIAAGSEIRIGRRARTLALLVPASGDPHIEPDLRLANLSVTNRARCRVVDAGREVIDDFGIVECTSNDPEVQATFLDVLEWLLPLDGLASVERIRALVSALVQLFSATLEPPRTSVVGLWGELWLIARSPDPAALALAWHSEPRDRWDFAAPGVRLEVKTATGPRRHHFSLEQLTPPPATRLYVASILTAELSAGPSLADLLSRVVDATSDVELRSRVVATAMGSLGAGWASARTASYDDGLAEATLRVLDSHTVPRVPQPPAEVFGVTFQADVEDVDGVGPESVLERWLRRVLWGAN